MKQRYLFLVLLITIFSCEKEDETPGVKLTQAEIDLIHNGSEKTWRVVEVYENYGANRVDDMRDCIIDDTYTFYANSSVVQMNLGEVSCYWDSPDEQASMLAFNYYPEEGTAYLDHGRSESKDSEFAAILYIMELEEVSANRLFFANGTENNWGRVLILEAVD